MPTWTGGARTSTWSDKDNWGGSAPPRDGDDVTIAGDRFDVPTPQAPGGFRFGDLTLRGVGVSGGPVTVSGSFNWSGGALQTSLEAAGTGTVTTSAASTADPPLLLRGVTLTVSGALSVTGGGQLQMAEAAGLVVTGSLGLQDAGLRHTGGAPATVQNRGALTVSGRPLLSGGVLDVVHRGALTLSAGAALRVAGGATLHLAGGTLAGTGRLLVGEAGGGTLSTEAATTAPAGLTVELAADGTATPLPDVPVATSPALTVAGTFAHTGGQLQSRVVLATAATWRVSGEDALVGGGLVDSSGTVVVPTAAVWNLGGGALVVNRGRLEVQGTATVRMAYGAGGTIDNRGLLDKPDPGTATLDGLRVVSTGHLAVRAGTLALVRGTTVTASAGSVLLAGGSLDAPDDGGLLTLSGRTAGGALRGTGTVGVRTVNGGWVEPGQAGLAFTRGYTQDDDGNLLVTADALAASAPVAVRVTGTATVAGSLWAAAWRA